MCSLQINDTYKLNFIAFVVIAFLIILYGCHPSLVHHGFIILYSKWDRSPIILFRLMTNMTWVMAKPWGNGTIVRKRVGGKPSFLPALHHFKHQFMNAPPTLFGTINSYNTGVHFLPEIYIFHLACKKGIFCESKEWAVCIGRWKRIRFDQGHKMFSTRWMTWFSSEWIFSSDKYYPRGLYVLTVLWEPGPSTEKTLLPGTPCQNGSSFSFLPSGRISLQVSARSLARTHISSPNSHLLFFLWLENIICSNRLRKRRSLCKCCGWFAQMQKMLL